MFESPLKNITGKVNRSVFENAHITLLFLLSALGPSVGWKVMRLTTPSLGGALKEVKNPLEDSYGRTLVVRT